MKYKVLAFDIDGTLTDSNKEITPGTKEAIQRAMDAGSMVVIASGRPKKGLMRYVKELKLDSRGGYICALNGGWLEDIKTGTIIQKSTVPMEYYDEICSLAEEYKVNFMTYEGDDVITEKSDEYMELETRINGLGLKIVKNLKEYLTFPVPKFLMTAEPEYLAEVEKKVYERLHDRMDVYRSEPFFLELLPKNINKAKTLELLLDKVNATREELMAFGDGYNDITMLKYAGMGVAMGNSSDVVKESADYVTLDNDNDGIKYILDKILLD